MKRRFDPWLWASGLGTAAAATALDLAGKPFVTWALQTLRTETQDEHAQLTHFLIVHLALLGTGALLSLTGAIRVSRRRHGSPLSFLQTAPCVYLLLVAALTHARWVGVFMLRSELRETTLPRATSIRNDEGH